jgi:two-component sensor histidine kinase/ligand-binding sensor domain-containing protein
LTKTFALLLILVQCVAASAQRYNFINYTTAQGLGSSSVNHIFQDSKGYIWLATQGGGAARFNGKTFKNFTRADGLINNDVTTLAEDPHGNIWIGTAAGVSMFNGLGLVNYTAQQGLTDGVVYDIFPAADNTLWMATQDRGIVAMQGDTRIQLDTTNGLPTNETFTIAQDKQGTLWFGLANGIASYSRGKIRDHSHHPLLHNKTFFCSHTDHAGVVWMGSTSGDVIMIFPNGDIRQLALPAIYKNDFIGGIAEDSLHYIWLATDHGLLKYGRETFTTFTEQQGLSSNAVQTVMSDYENNIWAGTLNGGAIQFVSEAFTRYTEKEGLGSENITAVCRHPYDQTLLIGTGDGLYTLHNNQLQHVNHLPQIAHANIASLAIDAKGQLWIAAQTGLFVIEKHKNNYRLLKSMTELNNQAIVSPQKIIHDHRGNTWVATYGSGLLLFSEAGNRLFNSAANLPSNKILTVFEDSRSRIWIGTQDAGVFTYNGTSFQKMEMKDKAVWAIAEGENGNMYFGTGESGLCVVSDNKTTYINTTNGLSTDYIPSLLWDKSTRSIWLAGERGLDRITFTSNQQADIIHYREQDGFTTTAVNQHGLFLDFDQQIWIATAKGLWKYNKSYERLRSHAPKIQIEDIRLFYGKESLSPYYDSTDSKTHLPYNLVLPHNKNHLTFHVQALTTTDVMFQIKLDGQESEWSSPTGNNEVTFSNLAAGRSYTFMVRAISSTGVAGNQVAAFSFHIRAPWWQTWWFYTLSALVLLAAFYFFIQARERVLLERNEKLEDTVKQRTATIAQQKQTVELALTEKESLLKEKEVLLKEIHHRVKNNLQTISSMLMLQGEVLKDDLAQKAILESQSRVRSIALVHQKLYQTEGLEKVELGGFLNDLVGQITSLFHHEANQVNIQLLVPPTNVLIDKAIPLGLILNELLTNSLKYAFPGNAPGTITIEVMAQEGDENKNTTSRKVKLLYRDSGKGFDFNEKAAAGGTLGVELITLLSEQIGASIQYSNTNGSEFIFIFSVNL